VAVQGDHAYVGVGMRLVVLDASDPEALEEIGAAEPLGWFVEDVAIAGTVACVAAGGAGLYLVDISNPCQPKILGIYDTPGYAEGVTVVGRYAYVADGPGGLRIVDLAEPAKPMEVGVAYSLNYVFDVALNSQYAYLAVAGAGLLVADVSDPARPVAVSRCDTPGYAYGIAVSGNSAYIADGWEGLRVVDVSDPKQPNEVAFYDTPGWAMDVVAVEAGVYVADAFGGLRVMDASDRAKPIDLGAYEAANGDAQSLAASGDVVFVADRNLGLHLVDVSTPVQPRQVGFYNPMGFADGVAVAGKCAYVAAGLYGLRVVDLSDDRMSPQEIAAFKAPRNAQTVVVAADFAYVTSFDRTFYVVDISDPAHPKGSSYRFPFHTVRNMVVVGDILVMANEWGLRLIDISEPLSPCEITFMNISGAGEEGSPPGGPVSTGVAIAGNVAYVASEAGGLLTIDISDPRHPTMLGVYDEPVGPKGVYFEDLVLAGNFAYVIDSNILRVVDISDPRQPKGIGSYAMPAVVNGWGPFLAILGNTVYVADDVAGLLAVDVSTPANPKLAGHVRLPGRASGVAVDDNYIYVAAGEGGLFILQRTADSGSHENPSTAQSQMEAPLNRGFSLPVEVGSCRVAEPALVLEQTNPAKWEGSLQNPGVGVAGISAFPHLGGEERTTSSADTWTVSSAADSGPGTLRWCLEQARSGDTITFDPVVFPPKSPTTIRLTSALPGIKQGRLTIDGSNAGVVLDGSETPPGTNGLLIDSDHNIIKGLQILGFPGDGVVIHQAHNTIGGDRSRGAGLLGEGNVISGNKGSGLALWGPDTAMGNKIIGNYIGLDASGGRILSNGTAGVRLHARGNIVGGLAPADRNVISGNTFSDVFVVSPGGNTIMGNYIGTDASGCVRLSNTSYWSVILEGSSANNRVEGNVIVGGRMAGVAIWDTGSSYNEVIGNYIGLDASGTVALGSGMVTTNQPFNRIERNVINGYVSVALGATDTVVIGNFLGTDATGTRAIGSGSIQVVGQHNFVGGTTEEEKNIVAGEVQLFVGSDYNFIAGNYIGTDASGAVVLANFASISLEGAEHNVIQGNLISGAGIRLGAHANFNWLRANRITKNSNFGIEVTEAEGNRIVGNNFINNARNASDSGHANQWDDGREGNYWDDYTGRDDNGDGVGDIPYAIAPNGIDSRPLMKPR
jgi:parallel beta-helix repeat protein